MINYSTFYRLMNAYAGSQQELPFLLFNPASSIGMATQGISSNLLTENEVETTRDNVQVLVDQINHPVNAKNFEILGDLSKAYSSKILNTFNYLNFIKDSVDSIKEKIDLHVKRSAASNEIITQANMFNSDAYESEFILMPWDDIQKFGTPGFVVSQMQNQLHLFEGKPAASVVLDDNAVVMINNILVKQLMESDPLQASLSETQINSINEFLYERTKIARDKIQSYSPILYSPSNFKQWFNTVMYRIKSGDSSNVIDAITDIRNINSLITAIEDKSFLDKLQMTDKQTASFNKTVQDTINVLCLQYAFVSAKREQSKDVLVFGVNLINSDALGEFTENGFSLVDISKFIKARKIQLIDKNGFKTKYVMEAIKNVRNDLKKDAESLNRMANVELNRIRKEAFVAHVSEFMTQLSQTPKISNMSKYIEHMADDINYLEGSVESGIYGVIINGEYKDTLIQKMYEKLGKSYVNVLSNVQQPEEQHMIEAEVTEIVDVICSHMLTQLIEDVR